MKNNNGEKLTFGERLSLLWLLASIAIGSYHIMYKILEGVLWLTDKVTDRVIDWRESHNACLNETDDFDEEV